MNENLQLDALVFAPHPDDAELAMGGTIIKMVAAGKRVGVIDLCRGELGSKGNAEIRAQEAARASEIMGIQYRGNLDLGDGMLVDCPENRLKVATEIRRFRSPLIFVCPPFDPHPDHQGASRMVHAAFFLSRLRRLELEFPAYSPQILLYYFIHEMRQLTFAVDISSSFEQKMDAMRAFHSQFVESDLPLDYKYVGTSDYLTQVKAYNQTIGAKIGVSYAEGFFSDKPLPLNLPSDIL
ncbi:MAG: bacillithiol biosynthesis deacetylase BshB1 [bacterium]|jgi:bacillithiol biosynthesis deacetylase BshB1